MKQEDIARPKAESTIDSRCRLSRNEFVREYLYPRRPVILADATSGWSANTRWTPGFFRENFGSRKVPVARGKKFYKISIDDFFEYAKRSCGLRETGEGEEEPFYIRNVTVSQAFPELLEDFKIAQYFRPDWLQAWPLRSLFPPAKTAYAELFIAPPGAKVPLIHRDTYMTHSWMSQIFGRKKFWMVSPEESNFMYQDQRDPDHSLVNSIEQPDLERFPLFARARVRSCMLEPGNTLFIPAGWWHIAESLSVSISLSGNFVNHSNFRDFRATAVLPRFRGDGRIRRLANQGILQCHGIACNLHGSVRRPVVVPPGTLHEAREGAYEYSD
jgi:histone arginine demethylase JMJD6